MARGDRSTPEVYRDILREIHLLRKSGKRVTLSAISRRTMVPNNRLKKRLAELRSMGLVDARLVVTRTGYSYCEDYMRHVDRFYRKYLRGREK